MNINLDELRPARAYTQMQPFVRLTDGQMKLIMDRGGALHKWYKTHPCIHALIGILPLTGLFAADHSILTKLPWFPPAGLGANPAGRPPQLSSVLAGGLHRA